MAVEKQRTYEQLEQTHDNLKTRWEKVVDNSFDPHYVIDYLERTIKQLKDAEIKKTLDGYPVYDCKQLLGLLKHKYGVEKRKAGTKEEA